MLGEVDGPRPFLCRGPWAWLSCPANRNKSPEFGGLLNVDATPSSMRKVLQMEHGHTRSPHHMRLSGGLLR